MSQFSSSDLRHRITLQREILTPDNLGGGERAHEDIATVWAQMEALTSRESTSDMGQESITTWRIRIRWRDDISPATRIVWDGRELAITALHDDASHHHYCLIFARDGGAR